MKHYLTFFLSAILAFSFYNFSYAQIPVGKVIMEYELKRGEKTLKMNGAGIRPMLFIDLYSCGLYLKEKSKDPIGIAFKDETMSIRIKITSKLISRETMVKAIQEGFDKATDGNLSGLEERIELINKYYAKEIKKGDVIELSYVKDKGTICMMNGEQLGIIPGQDFKFALYKIWLGEKPVNKKLKKGLLGI